MSTKLIRQVIDRIESKIEKSGHYVAESARCAEIHKFITMGKPVDINIVNGGTVVVHTPGCGSVELPPRVSSSVANFIESALASATEDLMVLSRRYEADALSMLSGSAISAAQEDAE